MNAAGLGRVHRTLRLRQRLRQDEVAERAGVGRGRVSLLERGGGSGLRLADLDSCFAALGAVLDVRPVWRGAALDRLLDEGHARVTARVVEILHRRGWQTAVEVTFSQYGDRGSIDVLAWNPAARTLLVVEVKTELASIEGLLRPLDVKVRLSAAIARERFAWSASRVSRLVVLPEDRTARRAVDRHAAVLDVALPARATAVRRWLRQPLGAISGLWLLTIDRSGNVTRNPSAVQRVRRPSPRSAAERIDVREPPNSA